MAEFQYQGVDRQGKKVTGKLAVASEGELRMALRGQGIRPTRISKVGALNSDLGSLFKSASRPIPLDQLIIVTRQLQVLINAGVPIVQSLDVLVEQSVDPYVKNILAGIKEKVSAGSYFWEALISYPKAFPRLYISLIRAGEASGSIDQMLKRLTRYLEDSARMRRLLKSASIYPAAIVVVGVAVVVGMLVFVVPRFEELLKQSGGQLPAPTQVVVNASHFVGNNAMFLLGITIAAVFLGSRYLKSDEGKAAMDRFLFKAPLFGPLMQKAGVARFSRTMQTLLASGVNLIDAIDICKATIDNAVLEDAVAKIRSEVEGGKTLGTVINRLQVFPRMAIQMISVGENTGNLDKMLEKVADFYEEDVETTVGGMTKLIEPVVLVVLGGTVGAIMIAMYLPIFSMSGSVGN